MSVRVLYVCTANICRSPSAAALLRAAVAGDPALPDVEVRSAGTAAVPGAPGCFVAPALAGRAREHRSEQLTEEHVGWATLILTAEREHRRVVLELDPSTRDRTFTIRQAGRIAGWVGESGMVAAASDRRKAPESGSEWGAQWPQDDPRRAVPALPGDRDERWRWAVGELNAGRGLAGTPGLPGLPAPDPERRSRRSRAWRRDWPAHGAVEPSTGAPLLAHPDDVPDPHVLGMALHTLAFAHIAAATNDLVRFLREVASAR